MNTKRKVRNMELARVVGANSTCPRREVGCVIFDKYDRILSTGYNGVPRGFDHCTETPCGGEINKSGEGLHKCMAIHAEQNALMHCCDIMKIHSIFVTTSPCIHCAKMIANTSVKVVYFDQVYIASLSSVQELFSKLSIKLIKLGDNQEVSFA